MAEEKDIRRDVVLPATTAIRKDTYPEIVLIAPDPGVVATIVSKAGRAIWIQTLLATLVMAENKKVVTYRSRQRGVCK